MHVILLGAHPPPIGGLSIHIQRYAEYLLECGHSVDVLDCGGTEADSKPSHVIRLPRRALTQLWFIRQYARRQPSDAVVHFHVAALRRFRWVAPLLFLFFHRQSKFLTLHSGLLIDAPMRWWTKAYLGLLLRQCRHIIPVTQELAGVVVALGVPQERMTVIPAHIMKKPKDDLLSPDIVALRASRTLVMTSGYLADIYNFDILIDAMSQLDAAAYCFLFVFYGQPDPTYESKILRRLADFENVAVLRDLSSDEFLCLLQAADIYVRATVTDGDANTIREALDLGTTVFATSCVRRPEQCCLFRHDDAESLVALFNKYSGANGENTRVIAISNGQRILDLYAGIAEDGSSL